MTVELILIGAIIGSFLLGVWMGALLAHSIPQEETPLTIDEGLCSIGKPEELPEEVKEMLGL